MDRFIITPKNDGTVTVTIRIPKALNLSLEALAAESNRSRNELINMALRYALENAQFRNDGGTDQ